MVMVIVLETFPSLRSRTKISAVRVNSPFSLGASDISSFKKASTLLISFSGLDFLVAFSQREAPSAIYG